MIRTVRVKSADPVLEKELGNLSQTGVTNSASVKLEVKICLPISVDGIH